MLGLVFVILSTLMGAKSTQGRLWDPIVPPGGPLSAQGCHLARFGVRFGVSFGSNSVPIGLHLDPTASHWPLWSPIGCQGRFWCSHLHGSAATLTNPAACAQHGSVAGGRELRSHAYSINICVFGTPDGSDRSGVKNCCSDPPSHTHRGPG